jgi:hypothetical protein
MDHVLVDGGEFVGKQGVQRLEDLFVSFHDCLLEVIANSRLL